MFPNDFEQWEDFDGDSYGDNYYWKNDTVADEGGLFLTLQAQRSDAFPQIASQWSDIDGDGWGDNKAVPTELTISLYVPASGWTLTATATVTTPPATSSTLATKSPGKSYGDYEEYFGCPDADGDGTADEPTRARGTLGRPKAPEPRRFAASASDPQPASNNDGESGSFHNEAARFKSWAASSSSCSLSSSLPSPPKPPASRRPSPPSVTISSLRLRWPGRKERRQAPVQPRAEDNYARSTRRWVGKEQGLPEWKQYEMQQQAAQEAAIPYAVDLENL